MLVFDPRTRIDATDALAHEYVSPYHDPTDEPVAAEKFDWSFNDADLPVDTWKVMMYSEILGNIPIRLRLRHVNSTLCQISTKSAKQPTREASLLVLWQARRTRRQPRSPHSPP
jgi:p38 MAP kinase